MASRLHRRSAKRSAPVTLNSRRYPVFAALLLLATSTTINVLQAERIKELNASAVPVTPLVGVSVRSLSGFSIDEQKREVDLAAGTPTVVYLFSPTCGWCDVNWPNVETLAKASAGYYRVVAVTTRRGLREYVQTRRLQVDVLEGLDDNSQQAFGAGFTPRTIIVAADGQITHDFRGAYTPRIERQIENVFGVLLPGVTLPRGANGTAATR
jgi:hypothetical protein